MDLIPSSWSPYSENSSSSSFIAGNNSTTGDTFTGYEDELFQGYTSGLLTFASATCIIFILVGVPGNLITIIALARCKKVRNATAVFIINLSLSDLLFCCFNLPLAASTFWQRTWAHGELLCRLFPLMRYGLLAVSLFTVLAITINRYVMIGHPRIYPRIYRRRYLAIMVASTWLCAFGSLIPTWRGVWGRFGLDKSIGSCSILRDQYGTSPKEFLFIMAFIIPCLSIVVCYARIFYIVRKTAMRSHEPILTSSSVRNRMLGRTQNRDNQDGNLSDRQLLEKSSKTSREENSENSSSISNNSNYPVHQQVSLSHQHHQHQHHQKQQQEPNVTQSRTTATTKQSLQELKEDEMKFIDTSIDSDFSQTLPVLKKERRERTPLNAMDSIRERIANGGNVLQLPSIRRKDTDSAVEDSTSSSDNNQIYHITPSSDTCNQLLSVQVEPSSSSGVDLPLDRESPPRRKTFKKSFKTSLSRIKRRSVHNMSAKNTSGASILYPGRMTQKDRRLLKMILVIFLSFLLCYLPITVTKIWKGITDIHIFSIMGYLLIYLTTCINPIIYVVMSSEYRQAYWNLLLCRAATGRSNIPSLAPNRLNNEGKTKGIS